jgi:catechol 2,3-dioxygenase-like lactoylglutathione lyase family enzyme
MADQQAAATKFHLSLNVADLERSIAFYRALFGSEPAKQHPDYAKFEVADPPLVLALEPRATDGPGRLNHVGVRVGTADAIRAYQSRLDAAGCEVQRIENVECCYSRQTKICTFDPDRNLWEVYLLEGESAEVVASGGAAPPRAVEEASQSALEHRLGQPFPFTSANAGGSIDEVHLRGTFNAALSLQERTSILREIQRVLRPGGRLSLHLMVGDRPVARELPRMPGPAALVRHVPIAAELMREIEAAGFVALECVRYSPSPVFRFDGVEMRELMLACVKPPDAVDAAPEEAVLIYKGPFREITDDGGRVYRRGEQVRIDRHAVVALRASRLIDHFAVLASDPSCGAGCAPSA